MALNKINIIIVLSCFSLIIKAQNYVVNGEMAASGAGTRIVPYDWIACSNASTPDIFYSLPDNGLQSLDNSQFVRLRVRGEDYGGDPHPKRSYEGLYTKLVTPLEKGYCYSLSVDLGFAYTQRSTLPGIFELWATNDSCVEDKQIFKSPVIDNEEFRRFNFSFQVTEDNYDYIFIRPNCDTAAFNTVLYSTIVLVDNIKIEKKGPIDQINYDTVFYTIDPPMQLTATPGAIYRWSNSDILSNDRIRNPFLYEFIDDIQVVVEDYYNCPVTDKIHLEFNCNYLYAKQIQYEQDVYFRLNENITFGTVTESGSYLWSPAEYLSNDTVSKPQFLGYGDNFQEKIAFTARLMDQYGCPYNEKINLIRDCGLLYPDSGYIVALDTTFTEDAEIVLETEGALTGIWQPPKGLSCYDCNNPVATPMSTQIYTVELNDKYFCPHTEIFKINIEIMVPNVITPGTSEGFNDYFRIIGLPEGSKMLIFDKNGNLVFKETEDYRENWWDGKNIYTKEMVKTGTYWYALEVNGENSVRRGFVFVKR